MKATAKRPACYEDLLGLPNNVVGEIIAGELVVSPRPAVPHATVTSVLGMDLGSPFQRGRGGPGGWNILDEPELHLHGDILVPDLAGWRVARMPTPPNSAFIELPPDWICEVLSPATAGWDRVGKLPIYAREHVQNVWLIDPSARTLEVFRREGEHWLLLASHRDNERVRAEPFDAVELELGALWTGGSFDTGAR